MYYALEKCLNTTAGIINLSTFLLTNCLIVIPVQAFVMVVILQRLLQSSGAALSHSDHFLFQMCICEVLGLAGFILASGGAMAGFHHVGFVGLFILSSVTCAHMLFDTLTSVERYLAVCHPITYRKLKNSKGVQVRNVAIGCTWLSCLPVTVLIATDDVSVVNTFFLTFAVLSLMMVFFCSLSVLFVLIRPGPGKECGFRPKVDKSKLRAFYIILIILAVMLTKMGGSGLVSAFSPNLDFSTKCHLVLSGQWLKLPNSLRIVVLFLFQRTQK